MRLTWRKRSAAPRELLVLVLFLVTLFFVVVIGERNGLPAAEVGHRGSPEVGNLPAVPVSQFYTPSPVPDARTVVRRAQAECHESVTSVTGTCHKGNSLLESRWCAALSSSPPHCSQPSW